MPRCSEDLERLRFNLSPAASLRFNAVVATGYAEGTLRFDAGAFAPLRFMASLFPMAALDAPLGEEKVGRERC